MQLVMKFTQAYVNTHANKLFSLSFWPVASAGGIWDLKLCPARIRIPEIDTEKKMDPSFNGNQEHTGHLHFRWCAALLAHTHGKRQSHLSKHKDKRCKWNCAKKPPYTMRERPDTYSWPCKVSVKRNWWGREGQEHLRGFKVGPSVEVAAVPMISW